MDGVDDPFLLGEEHVFHFGGRSDEVAAADHGDGSVEIVEGHLAERRGDRVQVAAALTGVAGEDQLAGLLQRLDQHVVLEGADEAKVDDFHIDTVVVLKHLGRVHGLVERGAKGHQGQVFAGLAHDGFPFRSFVEAFGNTRLFEQLADVVEALALKEDHGVGPAQGEVQHSLRVGGSRGKVGLESGNVRHERRPVLRMLGPIFGSHSDSQNQRHLEKAGRHGLPLGHLVEDLVAGAAHKVAVHQLDHGAAAAKSVPDTGANDGAFADGAVEQPLVGKRFG